MNKRKAWEDLNALIDNLEDSIKLYKSGRKNAYRLVAIGLRTLLCDADTVLLRIFPDAALHPLNSLASRLKSSSNPLLDVITFSTSGRVVLDGEGGVVVEDLFYDGEPLPLNNWLEQPLISKKITIKEFISSIADKEGKHSDPEYNSTLNLVRPVSIASKEFHPELLTAIAEYVEGVLRNIVSTVTKEELQVWTNS